MKQTIKVKVLTPGCEPFITDKGDWIDLRAASDVVITAPTIPPGRKNVAFAHKLIPLGVAMELPEGTEAIVAPRSSNFKNSRTMLSNSLGIIDYLYKGDDDQWFYDAIAFGKSSFKKGDRICQFRIQLSQKATVWQKIKWLLSNGVRIKIVDSLGNENRGGIGSTGVK